MPADVAQKPCAPGSLHSASLEQAKPNQSPLGMPPVLVDEDELLDEEDETPSPPAPPVLTVLVGPQPTAFATTMVPSPIVETSNHALFNFIGCLHAHKRKTWPPNVGRHTAPSRRSDHTDVTPERPAVEGEKFSPRAVQEAAAQTLHPHPRHLHQDVSPAK